MTYTDTSKVFTKAAKSALASWSGEYSTSTPGVDETMGSTVELAQQLWVWYLESPSVQQQLDAADPALAQTLVRRHAIQILQKRTAQDDMENGFYTSDNVKDALDGVLQSPYLLELLPAAFEAMTNDGYIRALRKRYSDGVIPKRQSTEQVYLSRAVRSLTEIVNRIALKSEGDHDGPGSKGLFFSEVTDDDYIDHDADAIDPDSRRSKGTHGDPTADLAIALIGAGKEYRDEFFDVLPLDAFLKGAQVNKNWKKK